MSPYLDRDRDVCLYLDRDRDVCLYLDTSCLRKLLLPQVEWRRVAEIVAAEEHVVVSSLAEQARAGRDQGFDVTMPR